MDTIVAEELRKRYRRVQALDGVTFSVGAGEIFALHAANGAGKSTIVRAVVTGDRGPSGIYLALLVASMIATTAFATSSFRTYQRSL